MDPRIEERLVERAKTDSSAFSELYNFYFPRLYAYASYHLSSRDQVEEIVSLTFLKALEKLSTFTWQGAPFSSWLYRIARNNIIDLARKNKNGRLIPLEGLPETAAGLAEETGRLEDFFIRKEECAEVVRALRDLPEDAREIISLKFGAGLSNREIARIRNMKEGTVGSKLCRALRILREILRDEPGEDSNHKKASSRLLNSRNIVRGGIEDVQIRKE
jgi:RNA polymerase sigma-70 factor (ECF subfamily)